MYRLMLCKGIQRFGGQIRISSDLNVGSKMTMKNVLKTFGHSGVYVTVPLILVFAKILYSQYWSSQVSRPPFRHDRDESLGGNPTAPV
jgi:hypothetical protein